MSDLYFVDSNVLIYRHDRDAPDKQRRAREVLEILWRSRIGRVSSQVLHEFYAVSTRKLAIPLAVELARDELRQLGSWHPLTMTRELREAAWRLENKMSVSWWDSLIVAAALRTGCSYLLSEDLQDGFEIDGLRFVNPFTHDLAGLGLR